ncbi:hypothetical protein NT01EI_2153 [Edwardsiella ictaluri 93-146]|uniref:Uncharacterized protein n=1 Tax=Edwardsiella ictaluri (strain 93-146) TaxID=634503 RepID=C5BE88_EDWI9|nr:hypothetical protein NT01EI_2153 [Edwardsiella ictaluri 93-146]
MKKYTFPSAIKYTKSINVRIDTIQYNLEALMQTNKIIIYQGAMSLQ